ncbi:uncharacterized protein BJX67DRAFT_344363 [Aspergillus lucknowensis]|uniref:Uncharacterized protein n=1 Tax=Aspergillus lucknowensis TaxID=176173 RepID=A0ABR4M1I9_9EURO
MPSRRPTSPLALETCSPLAPGVDDYGLAGSDDELDESRLSARRLRIEKLGEAYLQGRPLFILSASLRGPLNESWVNPWKKDRKKFTGNKNNYDPTDQKVIPETGSLKRKHYHSPNRKAHSKSSATRAESSRPSHARERAHPSDFCSDRVPIWWTTEAGSQSPRFTSKSTDSRWLKKDRIPTGFPNIDPPTSPSAGISSRRVKAKASAHSGSKSDIAEHERVRSRNSLSKQPGQLEPSGSPRPRGNSIPMDRRSPSSNAKQRKGVSPPMNDRQSIYVASSSSQLPKFEYRLKQHETSGTGAGDSIRFNPGDESSKAEAVAPANLPPNRPEIFPPKSQLVCSVEANQTEPRGRHNLGDYLRSSNSSNTIENPSLSNLEKALAETPKNGTTSENNFPSAQPAPANPPIQDNITSLYSIAISKATSNRTEDHSNAQQCSTQAAVLMAQQSFQNDLMSPDQSPVTSTRKRRASQGSKHGSPNQVNITPFHKMNAPDKDFVSRPSNPKTGEAEMISTQYMIDATTPFTFSTEKKAGCGILPSGGDKSRTKKRKTASFAPSSPSESSQADKDDTPSATEQQPTGVGDFCPGSQQSVLPMALTGTTPPTAQEGQGAESFNLSQAIAEAGSWLQQSFEINRDITQCKTTGLPQLHPSGTTH